MTYEIQKITPIAKTDRRTDKAKFPFDNLQPGEGFFVPNLDKMPPAEFPQRASTLQNLQNHCNTRNKRKKNVGKVFKCALYPQDECWIQVWRES